MIRADALPAFVHAPVDRAALRRTDAEWQRQRWETGAVRVLGFDGEAALLSDSHGTLSALPIAAKGPLPAGAVLLGEDETAEHGGRAVFALDVTGAAPPDAVRRDLRSLAAEGRLAPADLGLFAAARSLLQWHARHRFCANCGNPSEPMDGGWRRVCPACSASHFPRTDPVSIVAVKHEGRLLLARQPHFPPGMYSALAGFVEPGETIEAAAAREIFEEAGVRLANVRYRSSQPWPFPSSLMIGLIADATDDALTIDHSELEDARWFTRDECLAMLAGAHPEGLKAPMPLAIAHHLMRDALAESD
jgi:NAD+ diphosphatase